MTDTQQTGNVVSLNTVRTSYLYCFQPYVNVDENGKKTESYCSHFIMEPGHGGIATVVAAMKSAAAGQWGAKAEEMYNAFKGQHKLCLKEGSICKPGEEPYAGKLFISSSNKKRPLVIDGQRNILAAGDALAPYSGCWVNARIQVWAQDNKYGKRINASLLGIQFLRHDEAFGGGRIATVDEFGVVANDADADAPANATAGLF